MKADEPAELIQLFMISEDHEINTILFFYLVQTTNQTIGPYL